MANLKEIKRKIKSVHNTQKTTNAMKLVSTAKLKKAEELAKQSRVYANKLEEVMTEIAYKLQQHGSSDDIFDNVFFKQREEIKTVDIVFVTSDKGLCGGFNVKTLKEVISTMNAFKDKGIATRLIAIGKVGIEFFKFQKVELCKEYLNTSSSPNYDIACDIINNVVSDFENEKSDCVVLIHNGYKNMISQEMVVQDFLPIPAVKTVHLENSHSILEVEPNSGEVLTELLRRYFEYNMYYALVDSLAAEHSARMQAMDNATNNAKARVKQLNLAYNKARQENITTELIEIISGVESMR